MDTVNRKIGDKQHQQKPEKDNLIKLNLGVISTLRNKLECLPLASVKLAGKGRTLPNSNT